VNIKVIAVSPKYQINLGYMARVSKNFGIRRLSFVKPRAKLSGTKSIMYAKHARELLAHARVYETFDESIRDCDLVIGTTGIWEKARSDFNKVYMLEEAIKRVQGRKIRKDGVIGLAIGRDDTGLTVEELGKCDIVAYIGTNPAYPVLNISHALAIMLYVLTSRSFSRPRPGMSQQIPDRKELEHLYSLFELTLKGKNIRNRKAVMSVFKRTISKAQPSRQEVHALITALK
jgi:TrmH family RNA methyltransferase